VKTIPKTLVFGLVEPVVFGLILFLAAGTFNYWQAWVFLLVFALSAWISGIYLLRPVASTYRLIPNAIRDRNAYDVRKCAVRSFHIRRQNHVLPRVAWSVPFIAPARNESRQRAATIAYAAFASPFPAPIERKD
jgi:hypothetical protein